MSGACTPFRPADAVANSGWWTAFAKPFASGQWTLRNYERVILADNMGNAFLNSLLRECACVSPGTLCTPRS